MNLCKKNINPYTKNIYTKNMYENYLNFIRQCNQVDIRQTSFKRDPRYTPILEHVNEEQGNAYIQCINAEFPFVTTDDIVQFCKQNDAVGNPTTYSFRTLNEVACSPTSIRYVYHALLILDSIRNHRNKNIKRIIELGCGYGGLFMAIHFFQQKYYSDVTIEHYYFMDLPEVNKLIAQYLNATNIQQMSYSFVDTTTFGINEIENSEDDLFFISNYCLTELTQELREQYYKHLLPKCSGGFIIWQTWMAPLTELTFLTKNGMPTKEIERPQTSWGNPNYFVRF